MDNFQEIDMKHQSKALIAAAALALGACAVPAPYDQSSQYPNTYPNNPNTYPNQYPAGPSAYSGYGYVDSVEVIPGAGHSGVGIGAVGGAIAGGVLGNQIGHGTGRAAATVGGAVAGGVIGNEIEKRVSASRPGEFRYRVRMDDGSYQMFTQDFDAGARQGDRVRVDAGRVYRM